MNRWPTRPETLIRRFEKAVRDQERLSDQDGIDTHFQVGRRVELARRDLLARITPATAFQARRQDA